MRQPAWNSLFVPLTFLDTIARHRQTVATSAKLSSSSALSSFKVCRAKSPRAPVHTCARPEWYRRGAGERGRGPLLSAPFSIGVTSLPAKPASSTTLLCIGWQSFRTVAEKSDDVPINTDERNLAGPDRESVIRLSPHVAAVNGGNGANAGCSFCFSVSQDNRK